MTTTLYRDTDMRVYTTAAGDVVLTYCCDGPVERLSACARGATNVHRFLARDGDRAIMTRVVEFVG